MFSKKSILTKTSQISGATMLSRVFGIIRERMLIEFLGANALSDAFFTAFKVPNSLRKMFAEGALTSALLPTLTTRMRAQGRDSVSSLVSLGFIIFEGMVFILCALVMWKADPFIRFIVPGFDNTQMEAAIACLRILMPFIFFISSSAILSGALQVSGHFLVHAFGPVILNIVFITALIICMVFDLSLYTFCWFILFAGLVELLIHLAVFFKYQFYFAPIKKEDIKIFGRVLAKFGACLISVSALELSTLIDNSFASFLAKGSISLLHYANRFMGIPLGVFAVAFSTVILAHFSRIASYAPKRLGFYVVEGMKFVFWVTIPAMILMMFLSEKIFFTLFYSKKFSMGQVHEAGSILVACLIGLFFFSINKVLLNVYYALHNTWIPAVISAFAMLINIVLNYLMMYRLHAFGLALATSIAAIVQTIIFLIVLRYRFGVRIYTHHFIDFLWRYCIVLSASIAIFFAFFYGMQQIIVLLPVTMAYFLSDTVLFWLWAGPLCAATYGVQHILGKKMGVRLYFIHG